MPPVNDRKGRNEIARRRTPTTGSAALGVIMAVVCLDMMAVAIVLPVLPRLVGTLMPGNRARIALVFGWFGASWAIMQFFAAPLLGALSDRIGRRPVILWSCFGQAVDFAIMAMAPSVAWLFVGRILSGISSANIAVANAYVADITPPERRAAAFGLTGGAAALGFVLGPAVGGALGGIGLRLPFWCAAALAVLNAAVGLFVLREPARQSSTPPPPRSRRRLNPLAPLRLFARPGLTRPAIIYALGILAQQAIPAILVLYLENRFGWRPALIGAALAGAGVGFVVVAGGLVRPCVRRFGEAVTLRLGLIGGAAGFAMFAFAPHGHDIWFALPVIAIWALSLPSLQGIMARRIGAEDQGGLQGMLSSISSLAALIGPLLFTSIYAATISLSQAHPWAGGLALLLAATLLLGALIPACSIGDHRG